MPSSSPGTVHQILHFVQDDNSPTPDPSLRLAASFRMTMNVFVQDDNGTSPFRMTTGRNFLSESLGLSELKGIYNMSAVWKLCAKDMTIYL